jgi:chaperonin GroEL
MKEIKFKDGEHIKSLKIGLDTAVDLAKQTLGGKGRLIMIDTPGGFAWTLDGVTVLRHTAMKDKTEDMGVKMVLEAANKQVKECGDGTTSVSVLLQAVINQGLKNIAAGADSLKLRKGIDIASKAAVEALHKLSTEVTRDSEEIKHIAEVSAHGDTGIAELVAEAIAKTTDNSIINVRESPTVKSYIELTKGMKIGSGWLSQFFANDKKNNEFNHDNVSVLVYEGKIHDLKDIVSLLETAEKKGKPLIIVSDNMDGEVLGSLAMNAHRNVLKVAAINPSGYNKEDAKGRLADLAVFLGCKVFSPDLGHKLEDIKFEDLGTCENVIITHDSTSFIGGNSNEEELVTRIDILKSLYEKEENEYPKQLLKGRLAAINGGVGTIYVGGVVGSDAKERVDRVDDAKGAALSALENGVVPGGGVSLLLVAEALKGLKDDDADVSTGIRVLVDSLTMPIHQILTNAGLKPDVVIDGVKSRPKGTGYNVNTDEYVDMIDEGILDPTKVEINVIRNASNIASNFLNTAGTIALPNE